MDDPRRKRLVRALRWSGLGLLVVVGALNVLANTVLPGKLSDEERTVEWDLAWTILPGRVHVRGLRIADRTDAHRWTLELDQVSAWIELDELLDQRLVISSAEATGARFGFERHPEPRDAEEEGGGPSEDVWTIALRWADISPAEEVCIVEVCARGPGRIRGGFELEPMHRFSVGPAAFYPNGGEVRLGETVVAEDVQGRLGVTVSEVDIADTDGLEHFEHVDADARLRADLPSLPELLGSMPERGRPEAGNGWAELDLRVRNGVVGEESELRGEARGAAFPIGDHRAWVAGRLTGTVSEGQITLRLANGAANARSAEADEMQLEIGDLSAELGGIGADLAKPDITPRVTVVAGEGILSDARLVAPWLPAPLAPVRGTGAVRGRARWRPDTGELQASLTFRGNDWRWQIESVRIDGAIDVHGELHIAPGGRMSLAGSRVRLSELSVRQSEENVSGWWGVIEVGEALPVEGALLAHGLQLRMRDAMPVLAVLEATADPPDLLQRVAEMEGLRGRMRLAVPRGDGPTRLDRIDLTGDGLDVEGWVRFGAETEWSFELDLGLLSLHVSRQGGETSFHPGL